MVHASLRRLGDLEGRALGLIDALVDVLGDDGTLLMVLGADPSQPFDQARTPSDPDMGVLAEVFRTRPGVQVSDHAADRFAAIGPLALPLIDDPPLHDYHGHGSTLERLALHDGLVLRLGADVDTVTLTHWAEYLADVPDKRRARRRYVRADVGEQWIDSLDDNEGIVEGEGGEYFSQILLDFVAQGHAAVGPVGACTAELLDARRFVTFAVEWMERNLR
jgi:aminoglycoside N3'-acetyltransferase